MDFFKKTGYILNYFWHFETKIPTLIDTGRTMGQKIEKSPGQKNSSNQINQFHEKIFLDQIPFFAISKMAKNQFLN